MAGMFMLVAVVFVLLFTQIFVWFELNDRINAAEGRCENRCRNEIVEVTRLFQTALDTISKRLPKEQKQSALYCSFCAKHQNEVRQLIAGPATYICDECVELCVGIINETRAASDDAANLYLRSYA